MAFAVAIIGILLVLLFPIPTMLLDFLLAFSIAIAVVILFSSLFINKALDLAVFPTILLITTVMRLSLNIASTRLILSNGHEGTEAAGRVIEAFGNFVMSGNLVIGIIVFIILTIINFVVITKGSGRIAEVAARFSLDAMPGKQMAIDADLSAGLIDDVTAKTRRKELEDESTFFGSMDGANKFVRGDAIAGLLITFINFLAGIIIGIVQQDMSFASALQTYSILTVGDGLVTQIPSLIISLSAGLIVTKSGDSSSTNKAIMTQLGKYPQSIALCSAMLGMIALMPGIPAWPFVMLSGITGGIAWYITQSALKPARSSAPEKQTQAAPAKSQEEIISEAMKIDNIRLELGYGLLVLVNGPEDNRLTDQIKAMRKQIAKDMGFIVPSVRIQDNLQLPTNSYALKIKDIECARGEVQPNQLMVMDPKGIEVDLPGQRTLEPAFGMPAMWVNHNLKEDAQNKGLTVIEPQTVITTHLTEVIKENIAELFSYSMTQKLLDDLGDDHKKLISDVIPNQVSISGLQRILQNLITENISIRDLPTILEAISESARFTQSLIMITEHVRTRLARQISSSVVDKDGYIPVVMLSPDWEQRFFESLTGAGEDKQLAMAPSMLHDFVGKVNKVFDEQATKGILPVLLVGGQIRPYVKAVLHRLRPSTIVLSQNEISYKSKIKTLAMI